MKLHSKSVAIAALVCVLTAGCVSTRTTPEEKGAGRAAIRVEALNDGRFVMNGDTLKLPQLTRRLKRRGAGRAVELSAAADVPFSHLVGLRETLVQKGVPNIVLVRSRKATAEVGGQ